VFYLCYDIVRTSNVMKRLQSSLLHHMDGYSGCSSSSTQQSPLVHVIATVADCANLDMYSHHYCVFCLLVCKELTIIVFVFLK